MPPGPARQSRSLQEILAQYPAPSQAQLDEARARLSELQTSPGQTVGREELGQFASPATPNTAAKDLVHRYGRESTPAPERVPAQEPDR